MKINHDIVIKTTINKTVRKWFAQRSPVRYFCNRVEWHCFPRLSIVKEYPIHIDIELSNRCQLNCPMCFRFHRPVVNQGDMEFDTFKRIVDEISGKIYSIKFTGRGEPLMNNKFSKFMEYLKSKKFQEIAIITNGQFIEEDIIYSMIDNGMDRVAFSIDGLKAEYEKIRQPLKYDDIFAAVRKMYKIRFENKKSRPFIRIQAVETSILDEKYFLKTWAPISDEVLFLKYKDYSEQASQRERFAYRCPILYQRMMVHYNGVVPMCINDEYEEAVMGNVLENSIKQIWAGRSFKEVRDIHKKGLRDKVYKNCARCALYREGP